MALNLAVSNIFAFNNISTTAQVVAQVNPARGAILFHNPGTVDIVVGPSTVNVAGASANLALTTGALGGGFRIYANGGTLTLTGNVAGAWQALSVSASGNPLTVMDLQ